MARKEDRRSSSHGNPSRSTVHTCFLYIVRPQSESPLIASLQRLVPPTLAIIQGDHALEIDDHGYCFWHRGTFRCSPASQAIATGSKRQSFRSNLGRSSHTGSVVFQKALLEVFGAKANTVKNLVNHLA